MEIRLNPCQTRDISIEMPWKFLWKIHRRIPKAKTDQLGPSRYPAAIPGNDSKHGQIPKPFDRFLS